MKFINIGFGNMVSAGRIVAIASPDSAPVKRLVQDAKDIPAELGAYRIPEGSRYLEQLVL